MTDRQKISRRIAKLLRIAQRDKGNQGATARKIADELMRAHGISVVLPPSDGPKYETRVEKVIRVDRLWLTTLAAALASQHGCAAYFDVSPGTHGNLVLRGRSDRLDALQAAIVRYRDQFDVLGGRRAGHSFRFGCAMAVHEMYVGQQEAERRRYEAEKEEEQKTAIALARDVVWPDAEPEEPRTARPHGAGDPPDEQPSDQEWQDAPINPQLYQAGYTAMRRHLGRGVPFFRHMGWRFK